METNHTKTEKKVEGFLGLSCQGAIHPLCSRQLRHRLIFCIHKQKAVLVQLQQDTSWWRSLICERCKLV